MKALWDAADPDLRYCLLSLYYAVPVTIKGHIPKEWHKLPPGFRRYLKTRIKQALAKALELED